jgi:hypothetical protein
MKLFGKTKSDIPPLKIEPTKDTPGVVFDKAGETLLLYGVSLPENVLEVFEPIVDWLKEYQYSPNSKTIFEFKLDYLNTASTKILDEILIILDRIHRNGFKVKVIWNYKTGDADMHELGEDLFQGLDFSHEYRDY